MANRTIRWNKIALLQFNKAIEYIASDSIQNAEKVMAEILNQINRLKLYPEIHPPDKFKLKNNGNYRAFELHRYRIAFHVSSVEIRILRVRQTSIEPKQY